MLARRRGGQPDALHGLSRRRGRAGAPTCVRSASTPSRTTCCPTACSAPSACLSSGPSSRALPAGLHWDRILFCAKEATYKTWYPLTHRWLGFEDAHITFTVDGSVTGGTFESRILIDPAAESGPPLTALTGRWSVTDGMALTAIVL